MRTSTTAGSRPWCADGGGVSTSRRGEDQDRAGASHALAGPRFDTSARSADRNRGPESDVKSSAVYPRRAGRASSPGAGGPVLPVDAPRPRRTRWAVRVVRGVQRHLAQIHLVTTLTAIGSEQTGAAWTDGASVPVMVTGIYEKKEFSGEGSDPQGKRDSVPARCPGSSGLAIPPDGLVAGARHLPRRFGIQILCCR